MQAIRQTPLFHRHEESGASFVDHHGWCVPGYFTWAQKEAEQLAKSVALGDVTWTVKLDLKGYGLKTPPSLQQARACHTTEVETVGRGSNPERHAAS